MVISTKKNCPHFGISQKWIFGLLTFIALAIGNMLRTILPITLTEMVLPIKRITGTNNQNISEKCFTTEIKILENITYSSTELYDWDEYTQGVILSSFYWLYGPMQYVYGPLITRFGGKYFFGQAIFLQSLLTIVVPWAVKWKGSNALIFIRFLMGVFGSAAFPAISAMVPHWVAPKNRTSFSTFINTGHNIGPYFATVMPALIIRFSGWGWPAVFYFFGALGILWFPFWVLLCYNNTDDHPFISETEKRHLQDSLKTQVSKKPPPPPYKHIFKSKQFWAYTIALFGFDWTYFTLSSVMPKYMKNILGLSIEMNGYLSALPYLFILISALFSSWLIDQIQNRQLMTLTNIKKFLSVLAVMGPSLFTLFASYSGCNANLVIVVFIVGMTLMGCALSTIIINNLDLSPNYAATILAIGNGTAAISGVLSPYVVGLLTTNQTIDEWRRVFWIQLVIAVVTCTYTIMYSSAEIQYWNDPNFKNKEHVKMKEIENSQTINKNS